MSTKFSTEQLVQLLQMPYRQRWLVVRLPRFQSVAEHCHRAWLIAMHLYDTAYPVPHNSDDRHSLSEHMLLHDATEVLTGDIPSTIKRLMDELAPGMWPRVDEALFNKLGISEARSKDRMRNTIIGSIAKIADLAEALIFLNEWGATNHNSVVLELQGKLEIEFRLAKSKHSMLTPDEWEKVLVECYRIIGSAQLHP